MGMRKLRVYNGPDLDQPTTSLLRESMHANTVTMTLGEILPLLADAVASNRTWLSDFAADEITVSSDLHDVLHAYRQFRRPGMRGAGGPPIGPGTWVGLVAVF